MQFRIGDRDPVTGLYDVIYPDGSHTRNGIKIFNSAHEFGDVVLATERSDGMMIMDSVKATLPEIAPNSFGLAVFGEKPVGYLNGQVFNREEEVEEIFLSLQIGYNPIGTAFAYSIPGQTAYSIRQDESKRFLFIFLIKNNKPIPEDLTAYFAFSGTGIDGQDYMIQDPPSTAGQIVMLAGQYYYYIYVLPINGPIKLLSPVTVVCTLLGGTYRQGNSVITATITPRDPRTYTRNIQTLDGSDPICAAPVQGYHLVSSYLIVQLDRESIQQQNGRARYAWTIVNDPTTGQVDDIFAVAEYFGFYLFLDGQNGTVNTQGISVLSAEAVYGPSIISRHVRTRVCNYTEN